MKLPTFGFDKIRKFIGTVFDNTLHAKRVLSLANATLGLLYSENFKIHSIGEGLAQAKSKSTKHAIKQVDRLLSNHNIDVWKFFEHWVPYVTGDRTSIVVALDWTEFKTDGHSTIALSLVTNHGRSTPLLWKTVLTRKLKGKRNDYEDELLGRFKEVLPEGVKVTVLADRGFGDHKLLEFLLNELGFGYVIRIRGNITVTSASGEIRTAADWVGKGGRPKTLRGATITKAHYQVPTVVCVHAKKMKEPWCLVSSDGDAKAREIINYYAKRWGIEPGFRDTKDLRFGMGMKWTRIRKTARRDRMFLLNAFAIFLMTMLGAAGERLGMDRLLKANTVKYRTHSLFRQGCKLFKQLPKMPIDRLRPLCKMFNELLRDQPKFTEVYCVV